MGASLSIEGAIAMTQQALKNYEAEQEYKYAAAYRLMRKMIPLNISQLSVAKAVALGLPETIAKRFWDKKTLWLIVMHSEDIQKIHIADLRGKYQAMNLDIVEMRAVKYVLPDWGSNNPKAEWLDDFNRKLNELAHYEDTDVISKENKRNIAYEGHEPLELFDPDAVVATKYDKLFIESGAGPVIKKFNSSILSEYNDKSKPTIPEMLWEQQAKDTQAANVSDYNNLDDIFASPKSRSSLDFGLSNSNKFPSPKHGFVEKYEDDNNNISIPTVSTAIISPERARNIPVETTLSTTSAAVETNSFAKALYAAKLRIREREIEAQEKMAAKVAIEEKEKLRLEKENKRKISEEENQRKIELEIAREKEIAHMKEQEVLHTQKLEPQSHYVETVIEVDDSSIVNTAFEEDPDGNDDIECLARSDHSGSAKNKTTARDLEKLSVDSDSPMSTSGNDSPLQELLLVQQMEELSHSGSSVLNRDGETDNCSSCLSHGFESEEADAWTHSSRKNSTSSNISSDLFLLDDSSHHEGCTNNFGVLDSFYSWMGLSSMAITEKDSHGSDSANIMSDMDGQYDSDGKIVDLAVTYSVVTDDACSMDDESSSCSSSNCLKVEEHVINNINSNGIDVDDEILVLRGEIDALRSILKAKEEELAERMAQRNQGIATTTMKIEDCFNSNKAKIGETLSSNVITSSEHNTCVEFKDTTERDQAPVSQNEDEARIERNDSDDDISSASDAQYSSGSTSDIAPSSCADSYFSYESEPMQSITSSSTDSETTSFITGSGKSNLKIDPPKAVASLKNPPGPSPNLPTSPFVSATPPSRSLYESSFSAGSATRPSMPSQRASDVKKEATPQSSMVPPNTDNDMIHSNFQYDQKKMIIKEEGLLSSVDILARIKSKHSRGSKSTIESFLTSLPPSTSVRSDTSAITPESPSIVQPPVIPLPCAMDAYKIILTGDPEELQKLRCVLQEKQSYPLQEFEEVFNCDKANELLLQLAADPDNMENPLNTLKFLVSDMKANVNIRDIDGRTPLALLFNNPTLGRFLVANGANVFMKDTGDDSGQSIISLCAEFDEKWLLDEFQELGGEATIINDHKKMREYVYALIVAGYATRAKEIIDAGYIDIDARFATSIMKEIHAEFSSGTMKEAVETFELLVSLGAEI